MCLYKPLYVFVPNRPPGAAAGVRAGVSSRAAAVQPGQQGAVGAQDWARQDSKLQQVLHNLQHMVRACARCNFFCGVAEGAITVQLANHTNIRSP